MKGLEFPVIGTKARLPDGQVKGLTKTFDINSPVGRREYFEAKVGDEIQALKKYFEGSTFIAYLLGKKNSGKGTYTKIFTEIFGADKIAHVSVGDLVRTCDDWDAFEKTKYYERLKKYYRGFISFEEVVAAQKSRSLEKLLPTEFILALLKAHIDDLQGKTIFVDGLPRDMDQVSYSLYFRDLAGFRDDTDMFVMIDIPESVIDARIKTRAVCPKCQLPRSTKLFPTSNIGRDAKTGEFYLICDNSDCEGNGKERLVGKEGDENGIEPLRPRLEKDEAIIKKAFGLYGMPKILLRNHVPVAGVMENFDDYELTPEYGYEWDSEKGEVKVITKAWTLKDDSGVICHSLVAAPVVVGLIKQLAEVLEV